ncbi:MAG: flagellar protein FlaG [Plesiomonas sp.]
MSVSGLSITPCSFTSSHASTLHSTSALPSAVSSSTTQTHHAVSGSIDVTHTDIVRDKPLNEQGIHASDTSTLIEEPAELSAVTQQINEFMRSTNHQLSFHLDEDLNRQIVSVVDCESGEVIRQLPSKEMLELAKKMADQMAGILLNIEA